MAVSSNGLDPNRALISLFQDPTWVYKAVLGGTLNSAAIFLLKVHQLCIPFSFCLWALAVGYILRVMRVKMVDAQAPLPEWNDWSDLFVSGLTWIALYSGQIVLVISALTIALLIGSGGGMVYALNANFIPWALSSIMGVSAIWLGTAFMSPLLMTNFAEKESTAAGFDFASVFEHLRKEPLQFLQAWLIAVGLHGMVVLVAILSIIGVLFLPFTLFVVGIISGQLFAQVWAASQSKAKSLTSLNQ